MTTETLTTVCCECEAELPAPGRFCPQCGLDQEDPRSRPLYVIDTLTGLSNAAFIRGLLDYELLRAIRHARALSVMVIQFSAPPTDEPADVAQFVRELAALIKSSIRETDTAGLITAHGNPTFAVVLPETNAAGAAVAANKLYDRVCAHWLSNTGRCDYPVRVGTATYEAGAPRPEDLLELAGSRLQPRAGWMADAGRVA